MADDTVVIYEYTLQQAIADGELVELFKSRWSHLTGGKPLVATRRIHEVYSLAALMEIWNEFVQWYKHIRPNVPEEEQLFKTQMNNKTIWLLENGEAFTILFPEEY